MRTITLLLALGSTMLGGIAVQAAPPPPPPPPGKTAPSTADARFVALYTDEYAWRQRQQEQDEDTPKGKSAKLPDVGPAAQAERLARWTATEAALKAIAPASLSPANRVNYVVYKQQIDALLAEQRFRDYEKPLNADTSFWGNVAGSARGQFRTADDYRNYIAMLRDIRAITTSRSPTCAPASRAGSRRRR